MKTFIGLRYNKDYVKKNGRSALYLLVGVGTEFDKIPLELDWPPHLVNVDKNQLLPRQKDDQECKDYNLIIRADEAKVNEIFIDCRLNKKEITMAELLDHYYNYLRYKDFIVYMKDGIKSRYRRNKISESTKKSHENSWLWLVQYKKKIPFLALTEKFIEGFEEWLQRQPNRRSKENKRLDPNTIVNILKYVRAYITLAIEKDKMPITNPFENADVKKQQDEKIIEHLHPKEVAAIIEYYNTDIPIGEKLSLCRFLIACHLSLRISDILKINETQLEKYKSVRKLIFHPQKQLRTAKIKTVFVHIDEYAMIYLEDCVRLQLEAKQKRLAISESYGRKVFKLIAKKLKIRISGFHMGRHSFATNYIRYGGKVTNLQHIMGHSNIKTTMKYVHIVEEDTQEDMISLSRGYLLYATANKPKSLNIDLPEDILNKLLAVQNELNTGSQNQISLEAIISNIIIGYKKEPENILAPVPNP